MLYRSEYNEMVRKLMVKEYIESNYGNVNKFSRSLGLGYNSLYRYFNYLGAMPATNAQLYVFSKLDEKLGFKHLEIPIEELRELL